MTKVRIEDSSSMNFCRMYRLFGSYTPRKTEKSPSVKIIKLLVDLRDRKKTELGLTGPKVHWFILKRSPRFNDPKRLLRSDSVIKM